MTLSNLDTDVYKNGRGGGVIKCVGYSLIYGHVRKNVFLNIFASNYSIYISSQFS